jgi:16S rRNA (cytosine967-C5)-methyltransferase
LSLSAREVALRILAERGDASRASHFEALDGRDRALALELVNGATKRRLLLDTYLSSFSSRPLAKLPRRLLDVLRIGVFQMLLMGIPPYAAVDSAVRCLRGEGERAFANGVLREIARDLGHVEMPSLDGDPAAYVSLRYSYPEWISGLFIRRFGLGGAMALCPTVNEPPPHPRRVCGRRVIRDEYLSLLAAEGYRAAPGLTECSVRLERGTDVTRLPGYSRGFFVVQDEGATAVSLAVAPEPGEKVWDVCAAPGGKTTHLAELMEGGGEVFATDIDDARIEMVREAASRLGLSNVTVAVADATKADAWQAGGLFARKDITGFHRILIDAPCSGLGVLRRHPDLRWNRRPSDIPAMVARQKALLRAAARRLLPRGSIVYSTCTLTEEENEGVWTSFLDEHRGFEPVDPAQGATGAVRSLYSDPPFAGPGYRYILPPSGADGFFVARAVRRG